MHILKEFISVDDLQTRWNCGKELIESFIYESYTDPVLVKWYAKEIRKRPDGGQSAIVKPASYFNGCVFDMNDVLAIEARHPELVQADIIERDGRPVSVNAETVDELPEYISAWDARRERVLSPTKFVEFLREHGTELPLYGLNRDESLSFYDNWTLLVEAADMLPKISIHRLDWENFQAQERAMDNVPWGDTTPAFNIDDQEIKPLAIEIEDLKKEVQALYWDIGIKDVDIAQLVEELAATKAQLAAKEEAPETGSNYEAALQERDAHIAALSSELEGTRKALTSCGALAVIVKMMGEGCSKEDIAKRLKEEWKLSYSQIGVLLHENPRTVAEGTISQCAKRLLGVAR